MTTKLRFRDHDQFHRAALAMAVTGGGTGLIMHAVSAVPSPWATAALAATTVLAALASYRVRALPLLVPVVALVLATVCLTAFPSAGVWSVGSIGFAALVGMALAWGLRGPRLWIGFGLGAAVAVIAVVSSTSIAVSRELSSVPPWLVSVMAGASFGLAAILALLTRHVVIASDHVAKQYRELKGAAAGEVGELVGRGYELWSRTCSELPEDNAHRKMLREGVLKLFGVAQRWERVEAVGANTQKTDLVERIANLQDRIDNTEDDVVKEQYREASAALSEQLRYVNEISTSRERVVARMHNYLAVMERLRLAVVKLESTTASRESCDVAPLVSDLEELGHDIDACSESLAEASAV